MSHGVGKKNADLIAPAQRELQGEGRPEDWSRERLVTHQVLVASEKEREGGKVSNERLGNEVISI